MTVAVTYCWSGWANLKVEVEFDNQALDHRLRALVKTRLDTQWHYADSIFEAGKAEQFCVPVWGKSLQRPAPAAVCQCVHEDRGGMTIIIKA